jgi:4'-phosphopantetheinyl transferase
MHIFAIAMKQVFHKIVQEKNQIYLWKVSSGLKDLYKNPSLSAKELEEVNTLKNEKRKIEFLACRIALKNLFNNKLELKHYESGRPYIKEANHISISHSKTYIAIAFGEENIGIDIEQPQEKMLKLMPRILSKKEFEEFQKKPSTDLACKMWGTKESVLKYIGDKKLNYKEDIKITTDTCRYFDLDFRVCFEPIEQIILTYVMRKT